MRLGRPPPSIGRGSRSALDLAVAPRLSIDPQRITAQCGLHIVALNRQGRIEPGSDGYFFHETRFLSRFDIRSAGHALNPVCCRGWGVRTLSSDHPAYNPFACHLGSVWPVSNAHACLGFKRYGFDDALHRTAKAMIEATSLFDFDRLPEVFGGAPRDDRHPHPGVYPGACSPQAWSASAIIQICHLMTGLFPIAPLGALIVDPALPEWAPEVTIRNFEVGKARVSLVVAPGGRRRNVVPEFWTAARGCGWSASSPAPAGQVRPGARGGEEAVGRAR